uniref:Uncharacterized protein n=1 Tax=Electrophorus electricus TaxID=8005 RepID=A0A4W4EF96_ELEEL
VSSPKSHGFPIFSCPDRNRVSFVPTGAGPFCPVRTPASLPTPLQLQVPERSHHGVVQPGQGPRQPPTASIAGAGSSSGAGRRDPPGTEGPGHRLGC